MCQCHWLLLWYFFFLVYPHSYTENRCHDANFVVISGTGGCHSDDLPCYQCWQSRHHDHYDDVIMSAVACQITSLTIVCSNVADQRKHQSSASLAFVWGIHRWPVNSPHKGPVMRKMFPFDDVIMMTQFSVKSLYPDLHGSYTVISLVAAGWWQVLRSVNVLTSFWNYTDPS